MNVNLVYRVAYAHSMPSVRVVALQLAHNQRPTVAHSPYSDALRTFDSVAALQLMSSNRLLDQMPITLIVFLLNIEK